MNKRLQTFIIIACVILLAVLPLLLVKGEFGGADGEAEQMILTIAPDYKPWAAPLAELPSETESMLFALQAAIGAGIIGYTFGLLRGRSVRMKKS